MLGICHGIELCQFPGLTLQFTRDWVLQPQRGEALRMASHRRVVCEDTRVGVKGIGGVLMSVQYKFSTCKKRRLNTIPSPVRGMT